VVLHHGRVEGGDGRDEVRPSVFNGLLGGARLDACSYLFLRPPFFCSVEGCLLTQGGWSTHSAREK
jgi:hypothetical protein